MQITDELHQLNHADKILNTAVHNRQNMVNSSHCWIQGMPLLLGHFSLQFLQFDLRTLHTDAGILDMYSP